MIFWPRDLQPAIRLIVFALVGAILVLAITIAGRAHGKDYSTDTTRLPMRLQLALSVGNAACGITINNTWRRNATIANTGRPSQHRFWRAADVKSKDYECLMRVWRDWDGCLSTDWRRVGHVHIDTSGSRRCRFAHDEAKKRVKKRGAHLRSRSFDKHGRL